LKEKHLATAHRPGKCPGVNLFFARLRPPRLSESGHTSFLCAFASAINLCIKPKYKIRFILIIITSKFNSK